MGTLFSNVYMKRQALADMQEIHRVTYCWISWQKSFLRRRVQASDRRRAGQPHRTTARTTAVTASTVVASRYVTSLKQPNFQHYRL